MTYRRLNNQPTIKYINLDHSFSKKIGNSTALIGFLLSTITVGMVIIDILLNKGII